MALVVENWCGAATIVGIGAGRTDVGERRGGEVGEGIEVTSVINLTQGGGELEVCL